MRKFFAMQVIITVCLLCCCSPAVALNLTSNLKDGVVGEEYYDGKPLASVNGVVLTVNKSIIRISGLYGKVVWSIEEGTLPDGLIYNTPNYTINSSAIGTSTKYDYCPMLIKGVPTRAGSFTFTVKAVSNGVTATKTFTITIADSQTDTAPVITADSLPNASTDIPYSYSFSESESFSAVWTLISGDLPAGLTLSSDGTVSGTPTTAGSFSFVVQAQSSSGTDTKLFTINVTFSPIRAPKITTVSLPDAFIDSPYGCKLQASGTSTGLTSLTWSADNLPDGLTLSKAGYLSGTPKTEGTFSITVQAANSVNSDSKTLTLKISASPSKSKPSITTNTPYIAGTGEQYTCQLMASGTPPFTYTIKGKLPDGLSINEAGLITGTPSKKGKKIITVTAGNNFGKDTKKITLNVYDLPAIVTETLKDATVAKKYNASFKAKGTAPLTWEFEGYLPDGLKIDEKKHKISGTPAENTTGEIRLTVSNYAGELSRVFVPKANAILPVIQTKSLKKGTYGKNYKATIKVKGTAPITLSLLGSLPEGLSFDSKSGNITGTPIEVCTDRKIVITASNMGGSADKEYSLTIKAIAPKITTKKLPDAAQGSTYTFDVEATGTPAITWSAEGLPSGLSMNTNGTISGTPTQSGKFSVKVSAANSAKTAKKSYKLTVTASTTQTAASTQKAGSSHQTADTLNTEAEYIAQNVSRNLSARNHVEMNDVETNDDVFTGGYSIVADLGTVSVDEAGMYDFTVTLSDDVPAGKELLYLAGSNEPSDDDTIAEFVDDTGREISAVPENRNVTVSVWLKKGIIYTPSLAVRH